MKTKTKIIYILTITISFSFGYFYKSSSNLKKHEALIKHTFEEREKKTSYSRIKENTKQCQFDDKQLLAALKSSFMENLTLLQTGLTVSSNDIRMIIREEIRDISSQNQMIARQEKSQNEELASISSDEKLFNYQTTSDYVHNTLNSGTWTIEDSLTVSSNIQLMSQDQAEALREKIYSAINNGSLKMQGEAFPP